MNDRGYLVVYQDTLKLVTRKFKTIGEHKVFDYLMDSLRFGNMVYAHTTEIAVDLDMLRTNVSRSLRLLQNANIVVKVRRGEYMVNPMIMRKGENIHGELTAKYEIARRAVL